MRILRHRWLMIAISIGFSSPAFANFDHVDASPLTRTMNPVVLDAGSYLPISFMGKTYNFFKVQEIKDGRGIYFVPGGQNPDQATEAIIINYISSQDSQGNALSAEQIAMAMAQNSKRKGATVIAPFGAPDPLNKSQNAFFMSMYYVYPNDGNGDIWISKVAQAGNKVIGILYKHQVSGPDAATITMNIKSWLAQNLQTYGGALGSLIPPTEPNGKK